MLSFTIQSFYDLMDRLDRKFVQDSSKVNASKWQAQDITSRPEMTPYELLNVSLHWPSPPTTIGGIQAAVKPNLPWAEGHFQERVSGEPLNPPPSHERWPFAQQSNAEHRPDGERFSHTYPERFWPKFANEGQVRPNGRQVFVPHNGIRFEYGDLDNVIIHLVDEPETRQAYLAVWFPEDQSVLGQERVPCTLGYHFIQRDNKLHCVYYIRSCDYMRHFRDDVYMALRLQQHVLEQATPRIKGGDKPVWQMGSFTMHITSFHVFEGDLPILRSRL